MANGYGRHFIRARAVAAGIMVIGTALAVAALAQGAAVAGAALTEAEGSLSLRLLPWVVGIAATVLGFIGKGIMEALDTIRTTTIPALTNEVKATAATLDKHTAMTDLKFQRLEKESEERLQLVKRVEGAAIEAAAKAGNAVALAEQSAIHFEAIAMKLDLTPMRHIDLNPPQAPTALHIHRGRKPHPTGG